MRTSALYPGILATTEIRVSKKRHPRRKDLRPGESDEALRRLNESLPDYENLSLAAARERRERGSPMYGELRTVPRDPEAEYSSPLDPGIRDVVIALRHCGVETFESCEGGPGHSYPEPTVRFFGGHGEGFRALGVAISAGFPVNSLRRAWPVVRSEPTGPWWELTLIRQESVGSEKKD